MFIIVVKIKSFIYFVVFCPIAGVLMNSGQGWKDNRKIGLEILRKLGMGKNCLAEKIQEEISYFLKAIEDLHGNPSELNKLTQVCFLKF